MIYATAVCYKLLLKLVQYVTKNKSTVIRTSGDVESIKSYACLINMFFYKFIFIFSYISYHLSFSISCSVFTLLFHVSVASVDC